MEDNDQDKSEQPTSFKLTRAREKGTVARGSDLGFMTGLCAFLGFAWIVGPSLGSALAQATRNALISAPQLSGSASAVFSITAALFYAAMQPLALMAGAIFVPPSLAEIPRRPRLEKPIFVSHGVGIRDTPGAFHLSE